MAEKPEDESKNEKKSSTSELRMPTAASINEVLRAVKILHDSGGKARWSKIGTSFGTKSSEKNMLNWALNAAVAFDLVLPHNRKAPYVLSEDGTKFTSLPDDQKKSMLLGKFLKFEGYRTILVAMKNNQDKSLKKQNITEMWSQVRDRLTVNTRQNYTTTFASVGEWCGALVDTGQNCSLRPEAEEILETILRGGEIKVLEKTSAGTSSANLQHTVELSRLLVSSCPHCGKNDIDIENEELLQTLSGNGIHTLVIKNTYYCRGCSRSFSRIHQRQVKVGD